MDKTRSSMRWGWLLGLIVFAWYLLAMLVVLQ